MKKRVLRRCSIFVEFYQPVQRLFKSYDCYVLEGTSQASYYWIGEDEFMDLNFFKDGEISLTRSFVGPILIILSCC